MENLIYIELLGAGFSEKPYRVFLLEGPQAKGGELCDCQGPEVNAPIQSLMPVGGGGGERARGKSLILTFQKNKRAKLKQREA
jgi:hypothetical protein